MLCPACKNDNPDSATTCQSCQAPLSRAKNKPRRRNPSQGEIDSPRTISYNQQVKGIFKLCLVSAVPLVGLILGPISALRAWRLLQLARTDPAFTAERAALVTMYLGSITGVTNWLGLALMMLGWVTGW
jgi:hypothetical protein